MQGHVLVLVQRGMFVKFLVRHLKHGVCHWAGLPDIYVQQVFGFVILCKAQHCLPMASFARNRFFFFISKVCVPYQGQILKSVRCLNMPMQLYEGLHYGVGPTQPWKRSRNVCKY